jgi:hypothetical protein
MREVGSAPVAVLAAVSPPVPLVRARPVDGRIEDRGWTNKGATHNFSELIAFQQHIQRNCPSSHISSLPQQVGEVDSLLALMSRERFTSVRYFKPRWLQAEAKTEASKPGLLAASPPAPVAVFASREVFLAWCRAQDTLSEMELAVDAFRAWYTPPKAKAASATEMEEEDAGTSKESTPRKQRGQRAKGRKRKRSTDDSDFLAPGKKHKTAKSHAATKKGPKWQQERPALPRRPVVTGTLSSSDPLTIVVLRAAGRVLSSRVGSPGASEAWSPCETRCGGDEGGREGRGGGD